MVSHKALSWIAKRRFSYALSRRAWCSETYPCFSALHPVKTLGSLGALESRHARFRGLWRALTHGAARLA